MSMFLIECNELNQSLIFKCHQLIEKILKKSYEQLVHIA
jgi:hypothetical protein